jgi:hypothetical protein
MAKRRFTSKKVKANQKKFMHCLDWAIPVAAKAKAGTRVRAQRVLVGKCMRK